MASRKTIQWTEDLLRKHFGLRLQIDSTPRLTAWLKTTGELTASEK